MLSQKDHEFNQQAQILALDSAEAIAMIDRLDKMRTNEAERLAQRNTKHRILAHHDFPDVQYHLSESETLSDQKALRTLYERCDEDVRANVAANAHFTDLVMQAVASKDESVLVTRALAANPSLLSGAAQKFLAASKDPETLENLAANPALNDENALEMLRQNPDIKYIAADHSYEEDIRLEV